MAHVRISQEHMKPIAALIMKGGLYKEHAGRSIAETVNALIAESPTYMEAKKQIASEQHVRPAGVRAR